MRTKMESLKTLCVKYVCDNRVTTRNITNDLIDDIELYRHEKLCDEIVTFRFKHLNLPTTISRKYHNGLCRDTCTNDEVDQYYCYLAVKLKLTAREILSSGYTSSLTDGFFNWYIPRYQVFIDSSKDEMYKQCLITHTND